MVCLRVPDPEDSDGALRPTRSLTPAARSTELTRVCAADCVNDRPVFPLSRPSPGGPGVQTLTVLRPGYWAGSLFQPRPRGCAGNAASLLVLQSRHAQCCSSPTRGFSAVWLVSKGLGRASPAPCPVLHPALPAPHQHSGSPRGSVSGLLCSLPPVCLLLRLLPGCLAPLRSLKTPISKGTVCPADPLTSRRLLPVLLTEPGATCGCDSFASWSGLPRDSHRCRPFRALPRCLLGCTVHSASGGGAERAGPAALLLLCASLGALAAGVAASRQDRRHFGIAPGAPAPGAEPGPWWGLSTRHVTAWIKTLLNICLVVSLKGST